MSVTGQLSRGGAVVAALVVTFLWSSSWVLIRWGLDDQALEPIGFAGLRYGLAALVLIIWVFARKETRVQLRAIDRRSFVRLAALGLVFYAVTQGAQFVAIDNQPAATTSLVLSWSPLLVAAAGFTISEHFTPRQLAGAILVAVGAVSYFSGDLGATAAGMIAALVGLAANVVSSLMGRSVNRARSLDPSVVTAVSMTVGAVILVGAGLATEGVPDVSSRGWVIILWLAVVNTAVAFTFWNLSLRSLGALESAAINNTMLIQIALLAWIFLDEPLGWTEALGIILVTAGVVLAQGQGGFPGRRTLRRRS